MLVETGSDQMWHIMLFFCQDIAVKCSDIFEDGNIFEELKTQVAQLWLIVDSFSITFNQPKHHNSVCMHVISIKTGAQQTRGLYYEAGFSLSQLTSGKTLAFRSYDAGSLFSGLDLHGNLC